MTTKTLMTTAAVGYRGNAGKKLVDTTTIRFANSSRANRSISQFFMSKTRFAPWQPPRDPGYFSSAG